MTQKSVGEAAAAKHGAHTAARRVQANRWRQRKDWIAQQLFGLLALLASLLILVVAATLATRVWPIWQAYSLWDLLTGQTWAPHRGLFGYANFIVGSVAVTLLAIGLVVAPAVLSGIFLAEYTSSRLRAFLKPLLDLLAGIPSVVYGLWGVLFVVAVTRDYIGPWAAQTVGQTITLFSRTNPSGYGLLAAGFVLAVMVFPFITSVTDEVMRNIPQAQREAALSLGATRWEATKCVVLHGGLPGIFAAIVLGISRAFGETLAIMMVAGNVAQFPKSIFDAVYPLPALIANNYGEIMSVPLYESALMGAALLLLVVVLVFNIGARLVIIRLRQGGA
ncbi:MAG: phosphate ABC transporter permease subunit PstC [Caldilineaceae bacterium]|nr:phosphate ABC transporter permease subunit PstC [Caldilineaceae bacterium]